MTELQDALRGNGLTATEAAAILEREGPNELPGGESRSFLAVVRDVMREPMLMLLLAAGGIYLVLGDIHDALILMAFAGLSVVIAVVQESRAESAINALRDLSTPQALVIRDGVRKTIASREVVRGDLLVVSEGSRIAADGWLVEVDALQADESILTGESVPVAKLALAGEIPADPPQPGGEGLPYVYAGTMAVRGTGLARVDRTGPSTQMGAIGQSLASLETEAPRLTVQTRKLVRWIAVAGIGVSVLAVLLYGFLRGGWLEALLSGIALAMSMLPEELPLVLTLFMTLGALRMSRVRVLARRGAAIETLGAATVLCTDKTGTLTENRMEVSELWLPDGQAVAVGQGRARLAGDFARLAQLGILACLEEPFDPMERAFHDLARDHPDASLMARQENGWRLSRKYPLSPDLLAMTNVWHDPGQGEWVIAAKGAPEAIAELCRMDAQSREVMERAVADMAARGLRVLGIAEARWSRRDGALPDTQGQFAFTFHGLSGLADPIRQTVPDAVRQLREAGIRIVMITGDYPVTADAIAAQAGIGEGAIMTGEEVRALGDDELARRIGGVSVFARVMPEQKLRIVRALKASGEVVAMTGDGVNDAPSLRAAHIGIAMGQRGTDVAREASSIVLLDDDFGAIVSASRLGRRIYDNLRKASGFILAVHLPIGGLALVPLLTGWPLVLGPVQIALLEMVVDPICSLAFEAEPEEPDLMRRRPRHPDSPLISRGVLTVSAIQGGLTLLLLLVLALWASISGLGDAQFRATCFAGLIVGTLALVLSNRSFSANPLAHRTARNWPLAVILALAAAIFGLVFLSPAAAGLFHFAVLDRAGITAVAVYASALVALLASAKFLFRGRLSR